MGPAGADVEHRVARRDGGAQPDERAQRPEVQRPRDVDGEEEGEGRVDPPGPGQQVVPHLVGEEDGQDGGRVGEPRQHEPGHPVARLAGEGGAGEHGGPDGGEEQGAVPPGQRGASAARCRCSPSTAASGSRRRRRRELLGAHLADGALVDGEEEEASGPARPARRRPPRRWRRERASARRARRASPCAPTRPAAMAAATMRGGVVGGGLQDGRHAGVDLSGRPPRTASCRGAPSRGRSRRRRRRTRRTGRPSRRWPGRPSRSRRGGAPASPPRGSPSGSAPDPRGSQAMTTSSAASAGASSVTVRAKSGTKITSNSTMGESSLRAFSRALARRYGILDLLRDGLLDLAPVGPLLHLRAPHQLFHHGCEVGPVALVADGADDRPAAGLDLGAEGRPELGAVGDLRVEDHQPARAPAAAPPGRRAPGPGPAR